MLTVCVKVFSKYCGGVNRHLSDNTNSSDNLLVQRIPLMSHLSSIFKNALILPIPLFDVFYVTKIALKYLAVLQSSYLHNSFQRSSLKLPLCIWALVIIPNERNNFAMKFKYSIYFFHIFYKVFSHELLIAVIRYFLGHNNVIDTS